MPRFSIVITSAAEREVRRLRGSIRVRVIAAIDALADGPRQPGVEKLAGHADLFRKRVGDYRIVFAVRDEELIVIVVTVGHRRDVYRHLQ